MIHWIRQVVRLNPGDAGAGSPPLFHYCKPHWPCPEVYRRAFMPSVTRTGDSCRIGDRLWAGRALCNHSGLEPHSPHHPLFATLFDSAFSSIDYRKSIIWSNSGSYRFVQIIHSGLPCPAILHDQMRYGSPRKMWGVMRLRVWTEEGPEDDLLWAHLVYRRSGTVFRLTGSDVPHRVQTALARRSACHSLLEG